jgi:uncharacterized protein
MYYRDLKKTILKWMDSDEILIIYGARQVGKTTLMNMILNDLDSSIILNCEQIHVKQILESKDLSQIRLLFGNNRYIGLDEAQSINNIGLVLKLIYDEMKSCLKIIVSGSSSFDLSNKIIEALTGRNIKFRLFPLSINELTNSKGWLWIKENLHSLMTFGSYPGIIDLDYEKKQIKLQELASDYLFRDVLLHENIRNSEVLLKLLQSLALQTGSQVSHNELAQQCGLAPKTIEKYLDLLEKSFVIYKLNSFSSNLRNELKKSKKYYFYDTGIRNALINHLSIIPNTQDIGRIWENFCISEFMKLQSLKNKADFYFWRTYDGAEIDLLICENAQIKAYEFKWSRKKEKKIPKEFSKKYKVDQLHTVTPDNMHEYLLFE